MEANVPCEKQNKLSELIGKVQDIATTINQSSNDLDAVTDRFIGIAPEAAGDPENSQARDGLIGQLEDKIDILNMRANQMKCSVSRLANSGVI